MNSSCFEAGRITGAVCFSSHLVFFPPTSRSVSSFHFGCWISMLSKSRENLKRFSALSIISGEVPRMRAYDTRESERVSD